MKRLISIVAALWLIVLCGCADDKKIIASSIKLSESTLAQGQIVSSIDNHGGFHGDGDSIIIMEFDKEGDKAITDDIQASEYWHRLPLSERLSEFISQNYEQINAADIANGFYFIHDRYYEKYGSDKNSFLSDSLDSEQSDGTNTAYTDKRLFDGYSTNLTAAIYDTDSRRLYVINFDT